MSDKPLHIVILAAGKGSRMKSRLPKVLHQVAGKPLLAHVLKASASLDPERIHVVVGHGKDEVISAFSQHELKDKLNWVEQAEQLGTGHAVQQALPAINDDAVVLMLTADVPLISAETLHKMQQLIQCSPLCVLTAIVDDPFGLGRIKRDDANNLIGIVEQKDASPDEQSIREINSGIICAQAVHLRDWLSQIQNDNAQQEFYLTDVVGLAAQAGCPIASLQPRDNSEVMGINSRVQLSEVECLFQHRQAIELMEQGVTILDPARLDIRGDVDIAEDTIIDINVVIQGPTRIGRNCYIGPNSVITASELADDVSVHPNTVIEQARLESGVNVGPFARLRPGTHLQADVRIGNFVETKNAKLDVGSKVNHLSYVGDAVVGKETNIGAGVITCNYDGANKHQTTIGDQVFVGSDCQLIAPVSIGDGATIGAGSTITSNVEPDVLAISRAKQRKIEGWQRPQKKKK